MFFGGDPFEHFAQQHGAGGGRARRADANVDTTKLYETLNVSLSWVSSWQVSLFLVLLLWGQPTGCVELIRFSRERKQVANDPRGGAFCWCLSEFLPVLPTKGP